MKSFFCFIVFLMSFNLTSGQSIFNHFENTPDVTYASISPKMFQLLGQMSFLGKDDPESAEILEIINNIKSFKVLITGEGEIQNEFNEWVDKEAENNDLETLMTMSESDTELFFYAKQGKSENKIEKLLMYSKGISKNVQEAKIKGQAIESVVLMIEGDLDLNQIAKLATKMDLPGGDQLKKAGVK